jgi:polyhydroxybutyrate depolymerase
VGEGTGRVDRSVAETVSFWVQRNRCDTRPMHTQQGRLRHERYRCEPPTTAVSLYTLEGGRHGWPGARPRRRAAPSWDPGGSATELIWAFFAQHPKGSLSAQRPIR